VKYLPWCSIAIILLHRCPISRCLIPHCIDIPFSKSTAVWSSYCLVQWRESTLILCSVVEHLALLQVLASERTTNYVDFLFFLSNAKVNTVIHHFTQTLELLCSDIKMQNLWAWHVLWPIKLVSLVTSDNENIVFVNDYYLSFTYT
jgi:hypothetical protein